MHIRRLHSTNIDKIMTSNHDALKLRCCSFVSLVCWWDERQAKQNQVNKHKTTLHSTIYIGRVITPIYDTLKSKHRPFVSLVCWWVERQRWRSINTRRLYILLYISTGHNAQPWHSKTETRPLCYTLLRMSETARKKNINTRCIPLRISTES